MEKAKSKNDNSTRFSRWLDSVDEKAANKGPKWKFLWQIAKFLIVSFMVSLIQIALVNLLYFCLKEWVAPIEGFLGQIFTEEIMGVGHSNWGYVLPFFLSNLIANTVGYFLNKHKTFKSNAPWWHYILYVVFLLILILFSTWLQGIVANLFVSWGVESLAPTIASMAAGTVQMILLFPLQKFVLLREHKPKKVAFRKIEEGDEVAIFKNWASDPEVAKYVTWSAHENVEVTKALVDMWIKEYEDKNTHRFLITFEGKKEPIGSIDVVKYHEGNPEIGYCLSRKYWNKGYMTQAVNLFIEYLYNQGFNKIYIRADENNIGSIRVIEKCGFKFTHQREEIDRKNDNKTIIVKCYEIEKE